MSLLNKQPDSTLWWTAAHLFDDDFYQRYMEKALSETERNDLYLTAVTYKFWMLYTRGFWQFKMKLRDRRLIRMLLFEFLHNNNVECQNYEPNSYVTISQ